MPRPLALAALLCLGCPKAGVPTAADPDLPQLEGRAVLDRPLDEATPWHATVHAAVRTCLAVQAPSPPVPWSADLSAADVERWHAWQEEVFHTWFTTPCAPVRDIALVGRVPTDEPADVAFSALHAHALMAHHLSAYQGMGIRPTVHGCAGDIAGAYGEGLTHTLALTRRCAALVDGAPRAQQEALVHCASSAAELQRELDGAESIVCEVQEEPEL